MSSRYSPLSPTKKAISSCWKSWKRRIRMGWDEDPIPNPPIIPRIQWNIGCISNRTITFWNMLGHFSTVPWLWEKIHEGISLFLPHHQISLQKKGLLKVFTLPVFHSAVNPQIYMYIYKSHRLTFLVEWAVWYLCLVLSPPKNCMWSNLSLLSILPFSNSPPNLLILISPTQDPPFIFQDNPLRMSFCDPIHERSEKWAHRNFHLGKAQTGSESKLLPFGQKIGAAIEPKINYDPRLSNYGLDPWVLP